ncbi:MAG: rhamnogalacturonan lyase, partial [Lachnospiraceae bacterium]|nr:rhamnogalacturonan lyase [Lachnospiraceae bacterium]
MSVQREELQRGLIAVLTERGVFLSWRLFLRETTGSNRTGLTGTDFIVYRNDQRIALVTDSTNYLDPEGRKEDLYCVEAVPAGQEGETAEPAEQSHTAGPRRHLADGRSAIVSVWAKPYWDIPVKRPTGGVTPAGEAFEYHINDMSVGDVNGDGEYEYIVKWDPSNSHDVSHTGYTGRCIIDCYTFTGEILWRLDMGPNIRAGAHYTQFMVFDYDGDGRAEMAVKSAPGTKMTRFTPDGSILSESFITLPEEDRVRGITHADDYVCSATDYRRHLCDLFRGWREHKEVQAGHWPQTLEECFGIARKYDYPLSEEDAEALVEYFITVYAPSRSANNHLERFEGFIYEGPEYLTMFSGDGKELETIP